MEFNSEVNNLLSIDVALTKWPEITLEVSEHFYVISWIIIIFSLIILFNFAVITTGAIGYFIYKNWIKKYKKFKRPIPVGEFQEVSI